MIAHCGAHDDVTLAVKSNVNHPKKIHPSYFFLCQELVPVELPAALEGATFAEAALTLFHATGAPLFFFLGVRDDLGVMN